LTLLLVLGLSTAASADTVELVASDTDSGGRTAETPLGGVNLIIDDGSRDNAIGLTAGGQFLWLNRFTPGAGEFPFCLTEISVLFGAQVGINVGELVDIYVYEDVDGDGDPGTGANFIGAINGADVQAVDDATFSTYMGAFDLAGPGDVLIAVVNRTAGTDAGEFPAAIDQTSSQSRSWIGIYGAGDPPDPPPLPADSSWGIIDSFGFPGNWMIRGLGQTGTCAPVPTLGSGKSAVALLAVLGMMLLVIAVYLVPHLQR
jgi:hypothetical protein